MKVAFVSSGCEASLGMAQELVAGSPQLEEAEKLEEADVVIVNFCAMTSDRLGEWQSCRNRILAAKKSNPALKIIAGGCIEGLPQKVDLSFADVTFCRANCLEVLREALGLDASSELDVFFSRPGVASIVIERGCNRRCTFCKTHFLNDMAVTSRPQEEILRLAHSAVEHGLKHVVLLAENSTEYGVDLGSEYSLKTLLEKLFEVEGLRYISVCGLCLDEVDESLLEVLQHPKIAWLQLEVQSLNDNIRHRMGLTKTTAEALAVLDALSGKAINSNFMACFPGHSPNEFRRELRLIQGHHLYYLTLDDYVDNEMVPSHRFYTKPTKGEFIYYMDEFLETVGKERKLFLDQIMAKDWIEATILGQEGRKVYLNAIRYVLSIRAENVKEHYHPGDFVRVKITGLEEQMPDEVQKYLMLGTPANELYRLKRRMENMRYFGIRGEDQSIRATGTILSLSE